MGHCFAALVGLLAAGLANGKALAGCADPIAGPLGAKGEYLFSSACQNVKSGQVELAAQVCSSSKEVVVFHWTKLNWSSGTDGIARGHCMTRRDIASSATKINNSALSTNIPPDQITDVYLPDLGGNNSVYYQSVEGVMPRLDGGDDEKFSLHVEYSRKAENHVALQVAASGDHIVFYLVLPRSIRKKDDLDKYFDKDESERLKPLVTFNGPPVDYTNKNSAPLIEFYKFNALSDRATAEVVAGEDGASVQLMFRGQVSEVASNIVACVGREERILACLGGPGSE